MSTGMTKLRGLGSVLMLLAESLSFAVSILENLMSISNHRQHQRLWPVSLE